MSTIRLPIYFHKHRDLQLKCMFKLLTEYRPPDGFDRRWHLEELLTSSIYNSDLDIVSFIIDLPRPSNTYNPLDAYDYIDHAARRGDIRVFRHLLKRNIIATAAIKINEVALISSASYGHLGVMRLLLNWPINAPSARALNGLALVEAATSGQFEACVMLLTQSQRAAYANCIDGSAILAATCNGHENIVRLLLSVGHHAPKADMKSSILLEMAVRHGRESIVELLLTWPEHAPKGNCTNVVDAMTFAVEKGYESIVYLLLSRGNHRPTPDVRDSILLEYCVAYNQEAIARMLLYWKDFPAKLNGNILYVLYIFYI